MELVNSGTPARILIVDDEAASMQALRDTLRDQGYDPTAFTSGAEALAALRTRGPDGFDLLLTDLQMPGMNGVQLLEAALLVDPRIIGIVMTGQGSITTAVEAMKAGAFDYVQKPFKLSFILPVLERALGVRLLRIEKEALEHDLRQRTEQLEAANRELEAFSYSVSHDLRAPLRAVDGFARILEEDHGGALDDEGHRVLSMVREGAANMGRLIDDLLTFSRVARQPVRMDAVDMTPLAQEAAYLFRGEYPGALLDIAPLPCALGDRALLGQAWANLIGNAFKYSSKAAAPRIEVGGLSEGGRVTYWVRDNGAGFDMKRYGKLFEVFSRLHGEDEFPGTGAGLAIVQRIIVRHGGRVWGEGARGQGATFSFELAAPGEAGSS
jgi:signal transduction histidine kinase